MGEVVSGANRVGVIPRVNFGLTVKAAFVSSKKYISPSSWASGSSLLPTVIGTFVGAGVVPVELPVGELPHADRMSMGMRTSSTKDFAPNERLRRAISSSLNLQKLLHVCSTVYCTKSCHALAVAACSCT